MQIHFSEVYDMPFIWCSECLEIAYQALTNYYIAILQSSNVWHGLHGLP